MSGENIQFSKKFIHGELMLGFWSFAKKGVGTLDSFFILKALSLYQFGVYQLILAGYAFLSDFFHDLFAETISNDLQRLIGEKKEAEAKKLFREYVVFRFGMALIPWAIIFFGAPYFSFRYGEDVIWWARILSFLFIMDAVLNLSTLLLKVRLEMSHLATRPTIQKSVQLIMLMYFFFFSKLGIAEIFISQIGATIVVFFILVPTLYSCLTPWRGIVLAKRGLFWPAIRSYGKWELPRAFFSDFGGKVRPWVIKFFLNTEAVGIFGFANAILSALKDLLPIRTLGLLAPQKAHDQYYMRFLYTYGTKYFVLMSVGIAIAAAIAVPSMVRFLFPHFTSSIPILYVLLIVIPIFGFSKIITTLLVVERQQKFIFYQAVVQSVFTVAFLVLFLPLFGIMGLAFSEIAAVLFSTTVRYWHLVRLGVIERFPFRILWHFGDEDRRIFLVIRGHARSFLPIMFQRA
ncbi:MAG: polysaccharide biosynthesis C-terminal domain-containing protein [Patescibacteria group bacterium]